MSDERTKGQGFEMKPGETPQLDFSTLVLSFATSAMINLGVTPDPQTKKAQKNLELARQNIEILDMLEKKTKGNLSKEEATLISSVLTEVRMQFVKASA